MKLRLSSDSIRLRLGRSEVAKIVEQGRLAETLVFGDGEDARLTYCLESRESTSAIAVEHAPCSIAVVVPRQQARDWAQGDEVGLYDTLELAGGRKLHVVIEKDFACLDRSDADNADTFPHPEAGAVC